MNEQMAVLNQYLYFLNHSSYAQYLQRKNSAAMEGEDATPGLPSIIPMGPKVTTLQPTVRATPIPR